MAKSKSTGTARKKRARRKPRAENIYYVVEVDEWDWSFWFGVSNMPDWSGPYDDYRHLDFKGRMLRPTKLKGEAVSLHFLPTRELNEGNREKIKSVSIGTMNTRRGQMDAVLSMPADVLPSLLTMATAEQLRYIVMQGEKPRYGRAMLLSFRFETRLDEDDLPDDE